MMEKELIRHLLNSGYALDVESPLTYTKTYDNISVVVQLQKDKHIVCAENGHIQRKCVRPPFTSIQELEQGIQDILGTNEIYTVHRPTSLSNLLSIIDNQESKCELNTADVARILGK